MRDKQTPVVLVTTDGKALNLNRGQSGYVLYQSKIHGTNNINNYHAPTVKADLTYEQFRDLYHGLAKSIRISIGGEYLLVGKGFVGVSYDLQTAIPLIMVATRIWPSEIEDMTLVVQRKYEDYHPYVERLATELASEFTGHLLYCDSISQMLAPGIVIPPLKTPSERTAFENAWFEFLVEEELKVYPMPELKQNLVIVDDLEVNQPSVEEAQIGRMVDELSQMAGTPIVLSTSDFTTYMPNPTTTTTASTTLDYNEYIRQELQRQEREEIRREEERQAQRLRDLEHQNGFDPYDYDEEGGEDLPEEPPRPVINPELPLAEQLRLAQELMSGS